MTVTIPHFFLGVAISSFVKTEILEPVQHAPGVRIGEPVLCALGIGIRGPVLPVLRIRIQGPVLHAPEI